MDKNQLLELAQSINHEYELGIWSEINAFMGYNNKKISDFILSFSELEQCFFLKILMVDYKDASSIFLKLVEFIEYKNATFYIREKSDHGIEYFVLSSMNSKKGFLLRVEFIESRERFNEMKRTPH